MQRVCLRRLYETLYVLACFDGLVFVRALSSSHFFFVLFCQELMARVGSANKILLGKKFFLKVAVTGQLCDRCW